MNRKTLAALLLLAFWAPAVRADYRESYRKGIEAADRGEWAEVARWMRQAVQEQPREGGDPVKIYGMRIQPYLPHYYLGLALAESGNCTGALSEWSLSTNQGVIQDRSKELKRLLEGRASCERLAARSPVPEPSPSPTPVSIPVRTTPEPENPTAPAEGEPSPVREQREQRENADRQAREEQARRQEQALRQTLEQEVGRVAREAHRILDRSATDNRGPMLSPKRRVRSLLDQTDYLDNLSLDGLRQLNTDLISATSKLESAAHAGLDGPPAELRAAARALFRADYREAIQALDGKDFSEPRSRITANLLLAAARYALFLESGGQDEALRRQALDNIGACRRLDPGLTPDPKLFSPRFLDLYKTRR